MTRARSDLDLGVMLDAWMSDVAPDAIPVVVLEEAFARTMSSPQVRVYPWEGLIGRQSRWGGRTRLMLVATATLLVALLVIGTLGGGFGGPPPPSPTPSATPAVSSSPSPAALVPVPIVPTATVSVSEPQGLATDGTAVWVLTATGLVQRIDPATNTIGPAITTGGATDAYQGISADAASVPVTGSTR